MTWHFDVATDIGGRAEQQDRAAVFAVPRRPDAHLVVLADGMGGHAHGDRAAQAVLDTAEQVLADTDSSNPHAFLDQLCRRANHAIQRLARAAVANPASTGVFLFLAGDEAYWAHVGDSRLYHFAAGVQLSRTRDHTVGELMKDAGDPPPGEPKAADLLYTCLGGQNALQPEFGASATADEDWFMLCSDGFWHQIEGAEAAETLLAAGHADEVAAELVRTATGRGGAACDNVSLVLVTRRVTPLARAWRRMVGHIR